MTRALRKLFAITAVIFAAYPAMAQDTGTTAAPMPRTMMSPIRITPVAGASSFTTDNRVTLDNFDNNSFSAGLLADFGTGSVSLQTGVLTFGSRVDTGDNAASLDVANWGIPVLARFNFSGKPHETVFLKAGVTPFFFTGDFDDEFNVMGTGGIGGNIPLGRNSSLLIDASYNRLLNNSSNVGEYQGITFLGGLSFNI